MLGEARIWVVVGVADTESAGRASGRAHAEAALGKAAAARALEHDVIVDDDPNGVGGLGALTVACTLVEMQERNIASSDEHSAAAMVKRTRSTTLLPKQVRSGEALPSSRRLKREWVLLVPAGCKEVVAVRAAFAAPGASGASPGSNGSSTTATI